MSRNVLHRDFTMFKAFALIGLLALTAFMQVSVPHHGADTANAADQETWTVIPASFVKFLNDCDETPTGIEL